MSLSLFLFISLLRIYGRFRPCFTVHKLLRSKVGKVNYTWKEKVRSQFKRMDRTHSLKGFLMEVFLHNDIFHVNKIYTVQRKVI